MPPRHPHTQVLEDEEQAAEPRVAAISIAPALPTALQPVDISITGLALGSTFSYELIIHQGAGTQTITIPVIPDVNGNADITMVPALPGGGTFTVDLMQTRFLVYATTTVTVVGGSS